MSARGWEAGLLTRAEKLTDVTAGPPVLLVVDYPEQRLAGLGPVLEQLASRAAGPQVRVLLLTREPSARSHWWADLDRTSHRTVTGFTTLRRDLAEHTLSLAERREHADAAADAFAGILGPMPPASRRIWLMMSSPTRCSCTSPHCWPSMASAAERTRRARCVRRSWRTCSTGNRADGTA